MAKSHTTSGKKNIEKNKLSKRKEKEQRKEERKANNNKGKGFEDMIAYVDEYGNFSSTPPDPAKREKVIAANIELGVPKRETVVRASNRRGVVSYFNDSKGFGFIVDDETQERIFTHVNSHADAIKENDHVTFRVERGQKGQNAVDVKLIS